MSNNMQILNEYVSIRTELDYINEFEPQYVDESPIEYAELMYKEYTLRMAILNKMK